MLKKEINIDLFKTAALVSGCIIAYLMYSSIYSSYVQQPKKVVVTVIKNNSNEIAEKSPDSFKMEKTAPEPLSPNKDIKSKNNSSKKEQNKQIETPKINSVSPILPSTSEPELPPAPAIEEIIEALPEIAPVDDEPLPPLLEQIEPVTSQNNTLAQPPISNSTNNDAQKSINDLIKKGDVEIGNSLVMEFEIDSNGTILNVRPVKLSRDYLFNITMIMGSLGKIYKIKEAEYLKNGQTIWVRLPPLTPIEKDKSLVP